MWNMGFAARPIVPSDLLRKTYYMSGYGPNKPITGIRDPLYVRVLILAAGDTSLAFCAYDLTGLSYQDGLAIRNAVMAACPGLTDVLLFFTHSHAAIDTMGLWGDIERGISGRSEAYLSFLCDATVQTAVEAYARQQPGRAYFSQKTVHGVVGDTRLPYVSDHRLSQFRFEAESGSGIRLLHFTCHPEMLESKNTLLSADFVGTMLGKVEQDSKDACLFINGAVGGMQSGLPQYDKEGNPLSPDETTTVIGKVLAKAALSAAFEQEIPPSLSYWKSNICLPVENSAFLSAAAMGLVPQEEFAHGCKESEVGLLRIGGISIACLPGELFTELAIGGFLSDKDCAVPGKPLETTVSEILGKDSLVFGLCNDEIGYILPENDFYLDPDAPYVARGIDRHGRRHYEETNSLGPQTARRILEALEELAEHAF